MRQNWKIVSGSIAVIGLSALIVISGQKKGQDTDEPDVSKFPIVELSKKPEASEKQKIKNKKYNSPAAPISESSETMFLISDWDSHLPALPVKQSAAVVSGTITKAEARISEDQTQIYSEFSFQVDQVLKNDNKTPLMIGNAIVVERLGGRVRLPSGKIVVSATNHQDLPRPGNRYLLFLTHVGLSAAIDEDYHILTGYELRNRLVFPLDKVRGSHPINTYKGTTVTSLLSDLTSALAN